MELGKARSTEEIIKDIKATLESKVKEPMLGQLSKPVFPFQSFDFFFLRFFFFEKALKCCTSFSIPDTFSLRTATSDLRPTVVVRLQPERAMRIAKSAVIIFSFILITIIFA